MEVEAVAREVVDSIIKVHRALGPGLLESSCQKCLACELSKRGIPVRCEAILPINYDGCHTESGYRVDMIVADCVIVEKKCVKDLDAIHEAQLLAYLKLSGITLGFLMNWNKPLAKEGLKRIVRNHPINPLTA